MASKKGFGIMEVLVAAVVLGFLYMALLHLQLGNRETLLRIRGRDGAVEVAQNVMDSLRTVGLAGLTDCVKTGGDDDCVITIEKKWDRGERVGGGSASIQYEAQVRFAPDDQYRAKSKSQYDSVAHIYAKRVEVTVSWPFKGSTQSIDVSGVIR